MGPVCPHMTRKMRAALPTGVRAAALALAAWGAMIMAPASAGEMQSTPASADETGSDQSEQFAVPDAQGTAVVSLTSPARILVILMSGDGGWWGDIDAQLANRLAVHGYAVVGLDTKIYFADERTRTEMVNHVRALIKAYGRESGARHIVLAGYSFGANMVPLVYNDLLIADRRRVSNLVMISPERSATLTVTLGERLGIAGGTIDLAPEMQKLPRAATLCVYGADEGDDTGCTLPGIAPSSRVMLPGGHHFDHNVQALAQAFEGAVESPIRIGSRVRRS